ncbi:MAG TPA: hypothetical protein ENN43_05835 [bacterium]|nr:hypothetical protein [bacterium]
MKKMGLFVSVVLVLMPVFYACSGSSPASGPSAGGATGSPTAAPTQGVTPALQHLSVYPKTGGNYASEVKVIGNYAYLAENALSYQGLTITVVDISSKTSPQRVGAYSMNNSQVTSISVAGNCIYAAIDNGDDSLIAIDISAPETPYRIFNDYNSNPWAVWVSGGYLYVTGDYNGDGDSIVRNFNVFSLANPSSPARTGYFYNAASYFWEVQAAGNYAYVCSNSEGLKILDVSTPSSPSHAGTYYTDNMGHTKVSVSGSYAYCVTKYYDVDIVNVSNPSSPSLAANLIPGATVTVSNVYASGDYLYLACGNKGIYIYNVSNPASPVLAASYYDNTISPQHSINDVFAEGGYVYAADNNYGLRILQFNH